MKEKDLDLEKQRALYHKIMAETNVNVSWWDFKTIYPFIEQRLKEYNSENQE